MDVGISSYELAKYVDASVIEPDATWKDVADYVINCRKYPFIAIAVEMTHTSMAKKLVEGTGINIVTTIAYPLGGLTTKSKVFHCQQAVKLGADELDVAMNIGDLKSKKYSRIEKDYQEVIKAAEGKLVKAVIRSAVLNDEEIVTACTITYDAGVTFIKTNTGFGAISTLHNLEVIRNHFSADQLKVMVAGGVKSKNEAVEFLNAGAQRVATSNPTRLLGLMKFN